MSAPSTRYAVLRDFTKGLVTVRPPMALETGEAQVATNVDLAQNVLKRRNGWSPIHSSVLPSGSIEPVTSLYSYYPPTGTPVLFATAGASLMSSSGGDFTLVSSALAPNGPVVATYLTTQGTLYIATKYGASDTPQALKKWTSGGGLAAIAGAPSGWMVTDYQSALWLAGDAGNNDSRLYWSRGYPNQDTWPALNFVDVRPGDGDKVTGFGRLLNALIVFKERSVHRLTGTQPDDASVDTGDLSVFTYSETPGCVAPRSIASNNNIIIYLNRKGIYGFDGVRAQELSEPIRDLFDTLNENELKNAVGAFIDPFHYVLSVTTKTSTVPDLVISLRLQPNRNITIWKGLEVHAWENFRFSGITIPVLGLKGNVGRQDADTDNGTAISFEYVTAPLGLGQDPMRKLIRRGWAWVAPTGDSINIEGLPDFALEGTRVVVNTGAWLTKSEDTLKVPLPAFGVGQEWAIRIAGSGNGAPPEVHQLVFEYTTKRL